jgi:hypothetical protein
MKKTSLKTKMCDYFKDNPGKDVLDAAKFLDISLGESANIANELIKEGKLVPDIEKAKNKRKKKKG